MTLRIESSAEPILGYRLIERLGSGGFGEVWKAEAPGGIYKAIKIIHGDLRNRETDSFRFAEQELKAMKRVKQVRHPYLLAIDRYDIIEGRLFITMELADCNLWDRFRECRREGKVGIPREELLQYMSECSEVLDLFNDKFQLQHLDIKPQNLFLLYDHVKVADFGQVKDLQNHMAEVTGGITPVYAAPETFDGFVSRYCDQYSLACVYQELLTGIRPFDGNSMQQLLMQHLQMPPNLQPSPATDRPVLLKALAKRPEDRFPSVKAMVDALRIGNRVSVSVNTPAVTSHQNHAENHLQAQPSDELSSFDPSNSARIEVQFLHQEPDQNYPQPFAGFTDHQLTNQLSPNQNSYGYAANESPELLETSVPVYRPAPPEFIGTGSLRPAIVIGIGEAGRRVVQRFRRTISDQFGTPDKIPAIRTIYIDSDPASLAAANAELPPEDILPVRLNRAAHYLKPRLNGRTILDGWFDPQWLYNLPRNPVTMNIRALGRLTFCDHYRTITQKLFTEFEKATEPYSLELTQGNTGVELASNRPIVYVVTSLAGGTGSGLLVDLAYAVRSELAKLGYQDPEIVGMFFVPPDHPTAEVSAIHRANTYAALTELHHYARPYNSFSAWYDERIMMVRYSEAPFSKFYLLNGPSVAPTAPPLNHSSGSQSIGFSHRTPGSGTTRLSSSTRFAATTRTPRDNPEIRRATEPETADPYAVAADYIRIGLFTQTGPLLKEVRPDPTDPTLGTFLQTVGMARFSWPRAEVIRRTSRILAGVLLHQWVSPDATMMREVVPTYSQQIWEKFGLDPTRLAGELLVAAEHKTGVNLIQMIELGREQLLPKGWLGRLPEPETLGTILESWVSLIGRPNSPIGRDALFTEAIADVADQRIQQLREEAQEFFPSLVESHNLRLAGTEETIRHLLATLDRVRTRYEQQIAEYEATSTQTIDALQSHAYHHRGTRKLSTSEFKEAVLQFPEAQQSHLLGRGVVRVYRKLKEVLVALLTEVGACRQRLKVGLKEIAAESEIPAGPLCPGEFLPAGCNTTEDAVQLYIKSLSDEDLVHLDQCVQTGLVHAYGGLYQACLNSSAGYESIYGIVKEQTRAYLEARLGNVDLAAILFHHFQGKRHAAAQLQAAFDQAGPRLVGNGPWVHHAMNVYLGPVGPGGDPIREIAAEILPEGTIDVTASDEVIICREFPEVPLAALPQFGPLWQQAYKNFPQHLASSPHARMDVPAWTDIDTV